MLIIDELAALTAWVTDRTMQASGSTPPSSLLLSQGRAVGVVVVGAMQDPRKDVIPQRDLFPIRVGLPDRRSRARPPRRSGTDAHNRGAQLRADPRHPARRRLRRRRRHRRTRSGSGSPGTPTTDIAQLGRPAGRRDAAARPRDRRRPEPWLDQRCGRRRPKPRSRPGWPGPTSAAGSARSSRSGTAPTRSGSPAPATPSTPTTGEVLGCYDSAAEPDGVAYVRCGNRRASVCPSCSHEYKGDVWHVLMAGAAGGIKDVPDTVAAHPLVFATFTAPSFGPVHTAKKPGRPGSRRCTPRSGDRRQLCPHGRPLWCMTIHDHTDAVDRAAALCRLLRLPGHLVWQWWAPELWRRFTITLRRQLARHLGLSETAARQLVRVQFAKVAEYQRRGVIHFHALIRLDGPPTDTRPLPGAGRRRRLGDAGRPRPDGRRPGRPTPRRRSTATISRGGCGSAPSSTPARSPAPPTARPTGRSCTPRRSPPTSPSTPPKPPPTCPPTTTAATAICAGCRPPCGSWPAAPPFAALTGDEEPVPGLGPVGRHARLPRPPGHQVPPLLDHPRPAPPGPPRLRPPHPLHAHGDAPTGWADQDQTTPRRPRWSIGSLAVRRHGLAHLRRCRPGRRLRCPGPR